MIRKPMQGEHRTPEQLREHYEIEKELADRLRNASKGERGHLYSAVYDELFRRVPHHPQLTQKASPRQRQWAVREQTEFLDRFLSQDGTFLEVGPGDCALSLEATGFHLKEYTTWELSRLFKKVGFSQTSAYVGFRDKRAGVPPVSVGFCEAVLDRLPYGLKTAIAANLPFRLLLGVRLVGKK